MELRNTLDEQFAELVCEMFDAVNPVRTKDVAERLGRNYGTVKTHLSSGGEAEVVETSGPLRVAA